MSESITTWMAAGALGRLREAIDQAGSRHVVLVTGGKSYEASGAREVVEPQLEGLSVERVTGFAPNPRIEDVDAGLGFVERASVDGPPVIVGVGGGSAMDMAKLLAAAAAQDGPLVELLRNKSSLAPASATLILAPTTAGTGSEATHFATVYEGTQKYSAAHPSLRPRWAIVDPEMTMSLPPAITASTGLDALCQGIESFWAVNSTEASREDARVAIRMALEHLEGAVQAPSLESRLGMCKAANYSGRAIDVSKTTACHALSYGLTIRWDVPHGHAVATSIGEMLEFNAGVSEADVNDPRGVEHVRASIAELVEMLGADSPAAARDRLASLMRRVGLEGNLGALGVDLPEDRRWLASQVNLERLGNNPRRMSAEDLESLVARISA